MGYHQEVIHNYIISILTLVKQLIEESPQIASDLKQKVLNWFESTKGEISASKNPWDKNE